MRDVVVIGAGQAGLAASYYLVRAGADYLTLEGLPRVGDGWRNRWEGLRLFTPNRYNGLPGTPFPGERYGLPTKDEVAEYLERYVTEHALHVRCNAEVTKAAYDSSGWQLALASGEVLTCRHIVIAAGAYRTPRLPAFAKTLPAGIRTAHTSELRDPLSWLDTSGRRILVVGAGASGKQVAQLLSTKHDVTLAGNDPGHLPRRFLGRDVYDYLYGLRVLPLRVDSMAGKVLAKVAP